MGFQETLVSLPSSAEFWRLLHSPDDVLTEVASSRIRIGELRVIIPWYQYIYELVELILKDVRNLQSCSSLE